MLILEPQLVKVLNQPYVYAGDYSPFRDRTHGARAEGLAGDRFVVFLQNHDQVGNRPRSNRLSTRLKCPAKQRLGASYLLLSPYFKRRRGLVLELNRGTEPVGLARAYFNLEDRPQPLPALVPGGDEPPFSSEAEAYGGRRGRSSRSTEILPYECVVFGHSSWSSFRDVTAVHACILHSTAAMSTHINPKRKRGFRWRSTRLRLGLVRVSKGRGRGRICKPI